MSNEMLWQNNALNAIVKVFKSYDEVKALVLKGSLAEDDVKVDQWSDIDLVVIVEDDKINNFAASIEWIKQLGELFGLEKHKSAHSWTLRICLDSFQRFDFNFIEASYFVDNLDGFNGSTKILFSSIDGLKPITKVKQENNYKAMSFNEFNDFCNSFWFRCTMSVVKVMRKDYLISTHLALELAQDCIVLQMMIRDNEKRTNIHRYGEGEEVEVLDLMDKLNSLHIEFVRKCAEIFDTLALKYNPEYRARSEIFNTWLRGFYE